MTRSTVLILAAALLLPLAACDDDDGATPEPFALTVTVTDIAGAPVEGLLMSVAADLPYYQESPPAKAAVSIPFSLAQACSVYLSIEDVTGTYVQTLADGQHVAGHWLSHWNGMDAEAERMFSGYYRAHLRCLTTDTQELLFEDHTPMYMAILDPGRATVGTTDASGVIEVTDKRLFPHLYAPGTVTARDETGEAIGTIEFDGAMRFGLVDTLSSDWMYFFVPVDGPGELSFTWDPHKSGPIAERPVTATRLVPDLPPVEFSVGPPYPIPFN